MSFFTREQCLERLRAQVAAGKPVIGRGAGTGLSDRCAKAGGIDLIIIYNSGRSRMAGRGSLSGMMPYGDANAVPPAPAARIRRSPGTTSRS
jgi:predicted TIM-barrel enzyme